MTTPLRVIGPAAGAEPASPLPLHDRLRELVAPILIDDRRVFVTADDPVGGGPACAVAGCPRSCKGHETICAVHRDRWLAAGNPDLDHWDDPGPCPGAESVLLARLPVPLRWEIAYGIVQARQRPNPPSLRLVSLQGAINGLADTGIRSLLEPDEDQWPSPGRPSHGRMPKPVGILKDGFFTFTIDELDRLRGQFGHEHEYARDVWRLRRLGVTGVPRGWRLDFREIEQGWLRTAVKQFLRWRHDTGHSPSGMHRDLTVLTLLSGALTECVGADAGPEQFDRAVINRYLTVLTERGHPPNARRQRLASVRRFLEIARQHDWIAGVPASAALYSEDFPKETKLSPRALPASVMAQLESPENLAKLTDPRWRLLFPLLMETGLRINDALHLPQDCVIYDQQNAPYLRYLNRKMKREALVPISPEMATAINEQAVRVRTQYSPKAVLFPRQTMNPDGSHPASTCAHRTALNTWIQQCRIVDETGAPVRVTPHQFRHTLGTRLINNDVPQEVVRKILDHTSLEMTAHYARLHDVTVRRHWERARKVDIHGNTVTIDQDSPLADAQWAKQHLARATMALPNGYCGLPLQQTCPHANACLTCPVFITTPEFLPQHRKQLELTRGIIERARQRGQLRVVEMNQRTADNLLTIITSLDNPSPPTVSDTDDES
jgi:integrase